MIHPSESEAIEAAAAAFAANHPANPTIFALDRMLMEAFRAGAERGLNMLKDPPRNDASRSYVVRAQDITGGEQPYGFQLIGTDMWLHIGRPSNHNHQLILRIQVNNDQIHFWATMEPGPTFPPHIASFTHPWPHQEN